MITHLHQKKGDVRLGDVLYDITYHREPSGTRPWQYHVGIAVEAKANYDGTDVIEVIGIPAYPYPPLWLLAKAGWQRNAKSKWSPDLLGQLVCKKCRQVPGQDPAVCNCRTRAAIVARTADEQMAFVPFLSKGMADHKRGQWSLETETLPVGSQRVFIMGSCVEFVEFCYQQALGVVLVDQRAIQSKNTALPVGPEIHAFHKDKYPLTLDFLKQTYAPDCCLKSV